MIRAAVVVICIAGVSAFAQSPTPSARALVDALAPNDVQQAITSLRSNFIEPNALTDQELSRATLQGLIARLGRGAVVLAPNDVATANVDVPAYSEILENHIGYLRVGSFTNANLQMVDKALANFTAKKADAAIVDLRAFAPSNDFSTTAEFTKRFTAKGK